MKDHGSRWRVSVVPNCSSQTDTAVRLGRGYKTARFGARVAVLALRKRAGRAVTCPSLFYVGRNAESTAAGLVGEEEEGLFFLHSHRKSHLSPGSHGFLWAY